MLPGCGSLRIGVFGKSGFYHGHVSRGVLISWDLAPPCPCAPRGRDLMGTSCGPRAQRGGVPTLPFSPMKPSPQDTRVSCPQNILVSLSPLRPCAPGGVVPSISVHPRWPRPHHTRVPRKSCPQDIRVALSPARPCVPSPRVLSPCGPVPTLLHPRATRVPMMPRATPRVPIPVPAQTR